MGHPYYLFCSAGLWTIYESFKAGDVLLGASFAKAGGTWGKGAFIGQCALKLDAVAVNVQVSDVAGKGPKFGFVAPYPSLGDVAAAVKDLVDPNSVAIDGVTSALDALLVTEVDFNVAKKAAPATGYGVTSAGFTVSFAGGAGNTCFAGTTPASLCRPEEAKALQTCVEAKSEGNTPTFSASLFGEGSIGLDRLTLSAEKKAPEGQAKATWVTEAMLYIDVDLFGVHLDVTFGLSSAKQTPDGPCVV